MNPQESVLKTVTNVLGERKVDPITTRRIINIIESDAKFKSLECQPTEIEREEISAEGDVVLEFPQCDSEAITRDHDESSIRMSPSFLSGLVGELESDRKLTQFLGVSLRAVLPYAEQEVMALRVAAHRDNDEVLRKESATAHRAITRAQSALNHLNSSKFNISNLDDVTFDDDFKVIFEDEEG